MKFDSHSCVLIMGTRGCGKTTLSQNIQKVWPRRIILDTLDEYPDDSAVFSFDEFCEKLKFLKANHAHSFEVVYKFDPENQFSSEVFDQIMRVSYYFGNVQIVLEEVQLYASVHDLPHWLENCLLRGRHQNISLLFTTQRPGNLNKTILSQCQHIFCGQIIEGNDVRYVSGFLRQSADRLISLPKGQFIYFGSHGVSQISNLF